MSEQSTLSNDAQPTTKYALLPEAVKRLEDAEVEYCGARMSFLQAIKAFFQSQPESVQNDDSKMSIAMKSTFDGPLIKFLCTPLQLVSDECIATAIVAARTT